MTCEKGETMAQVAESSPRELRVLLMHHQQLLELYQAEHHRLTTVLAEWAREESLAHIAQLSRMIDEVKNEVMQLLQTPIRPDAKGLCRKTFRE